MKISPTKMIAEYPDMRISVVMIVSAKDSVLCMGGMFLP
jgi:hypothetical protein